MQIRDEGPGDHEVIYAVVTAAFLEAEHSGGNEAEIVTALRISGCLAVSLVATQGAHIVGHAAISPVLIDGKDRGWLGVGPVAVLPHEQRRGIGRALIEAGLGKLRKEGAAGCVVLGDPAYYRRFGFVAEPALHLEGVPPEYFQELRFRDESSRGEVNFHPAFGVR